ncbi:GNAT family N-acetyltransferase [Microbacterium sp.]|uniref:GNAT family N-acetyltransferase n=1 Tax=Microbacterium sp. TaxID=51671 RepID=UPI003561F359
MNSTASAPARGALGETTLRTDRLILRPQVVADAEVFHRLWRERDERVPPHRRPDATGHPTVSDIAAHIAEERDRRSDLLSVQDATTGEVYGYCGLVFAGKGSADEPEIAFELLSRVHNLGYATEAARAVLAWSDAEGYERLWASVWDWNVASRRVLEKLGFEDSGDELPTGEHGRTILTVRAPSPKPAVAAPHVVTVEHGALSESETAALGALFDSEYREGHGEWDPDRPYGYSPADVHTMIFLKDVAVAHVGYQRRVIRVGEREVTVAGTGGVLVHRDWRSRGAGRRVMTHAQQAMRDDDRVEFGYLGCREEVASFYERTGWSRVNAVERHVSMTDAQETVTSAGAPILIFCAGASPRVGAEQWPQGDIDLNGTPW